MRFAWLRKQVPDYVSQVQPFTHPASISRFLYNLVFWVFLLPLFTSVSYGAAFVAMVVVIGVRLVANFVHNNVMPQTPEAFDRAPMRIPL